MRSHGAQSSVRKTEPDINLRPVAANRFGAPALNRI
jgi:hypothetical protein